jgi:hypothetical protein
MLIAYHLFYEMDGVVQNVMTGLKKIWKWIETYHASCMQDIEIQKFDERQDHRKIPLSVGRAFSKI